MSKMIQALLTGMLMAFILDFFLFLGIKTNYIDAYGIDLYYNILFADNQNIYIYALLSFILGYTLIYHSAKLALTLFALLSLLVLSTLYAPIGHSVGEAVLMKRDVSLQTNKYSYHGNILYEGRKTITFYDYKIDKTLHLDKNKIKGEY